MKKILQFFRKNNIGKPPWDYYFLKNLDEKEYPHYLAKLFLLNTGENLPLKYIFKNKSWIIDKKKCKTFNQKIQWIKLYGVTDLMRKCTDKVAVRDYVKEKIGEEYLKPVLQICNNFDEINFDTLPNSFVIKCNHGCKWHFIIKNKEEYLRNKILVKITKQKITGWLEQDYSFWGGFEMQYLTSRRVESPDSTMRVRTRLCESIACGSEKFAECEGIFFAEKNSGKENPKSRLSQIFQESNNEAIDLPDTKRIIEPIGEINEPVHNNKYGLRKGGQDKKRGIKPKIIIEPLLTERSNSPAKNVQVYCFSGCPKYIVKLHNQEELTIYDENLNITEDIFHFSERKIDEISDINTNQSFELSKKLSEDFHFVRVDWIICKNKLYFEELTFTPYSGFHKINKKFKLNNYLKLGE